ncbi:MAG: hypothetical protein WAN44_12665 [Propionibacteriaceae bacterium]
MASDTPAAVATFPGWGGGPWSLLHSFSVTAPPVEQGRHIVITPSNSKYFDARSIMLGPNTTKGSGFQVSVKHLDEHVDATKVEAYCASKNESFARYQNSRRVWSGHLTFELGPHAPIVNEAFRATLAEDVMIH